MKNYKDMSEAERSVYKKKCLDRYHNLSDDKIKID